MPTLKFGARSIDYRVRVSVRARRTRIVVGPGGTELVVPEGASLRRATAWLESRAGWVLSKQDTLKSDLTRAGQADIAVRSGARMLYRGRQVEIRIGPPGHGPPGHGPTLDGGILRLPTPPAGASAASGLESWLRTQARGFLHDSVARQAPVVGRQPAGVRLRGQRTRWGSCGIRGHLNLNWRLVMAPAETLDYVVAHELCHLFERNHGAAFWARVAAVMPDYGQQRDWLRQYGHRILAPLRDESVAAE
jgi:predicted metal-dependent hydrolase